MTGRNAAVVIVVVLTALVTGCGQIPTAPPVGTVERTPEASAPPGEAAPTPVAKPVVMTPNVRNKATGVRVDTLVAVKAEAGTLTAVSVSYQLKNRLGALEKGTVRGTLAADRKSWRAAERLEPGAAYAITMTGRNASNRAARRVTSTFRTQALTLAQQTYPSLSPFRGSTVGIGMPVVLTFDVPVKDKAEVQRHLRVTSKPEQTGTWSWLSDREVHFRPRAYWKPGTTVSATANLNGVNAGGGIFGQKSASTSFVVGRSLVTWIDLSVQTAKVYRDGKLARTIPVTGGRKGWVTRSGTKLIMEKKPLTRMTSDRIGAAEEYSLRVRYAMRVTWSGEFLHAAPWSTKNLGRRNASHGCVGMSTADAAWLFRRTTIGDPVVTVGTSRGLERGNGWTDWDVSYAEFAKGSAL